MRVFFIGGNMPCEADALSQESVLYWFDRLCIGNPDLGKRVEARLHHDRGKSSLRARRERARRIYLEEPIEISHR
jgi:hypothetical protein